MRSYSSLGMSASAAVLIALSGAAPAAAQTLQRTYNIPAQDLSDALRAFGRASGEQLVFDSRITQGRRSAPLSGRHSTDAALSILLGGSGLQARRGDSGVLIIHPQSRGDDIADEGAPSQATQLEGVVVTGTRIRGATPASPVVVVTQDDIRNAGHTDLGQVVRSLPQNFNGGQNPTITNGTGGITNQDLTGGSSFNLRGLGPDATLTLLNGRRLSFGSFNQAVDASAIPVAAVARVEVITDGASALYGSDAVGGVANIITRRDFDGLETMARYGGATSGGLEQRQFSAVAGRTWSGGGVVATYDHQKTGAMRAGQRGSLDHMLDVTQVYSPSRQDAVLISGHQQLASGIAGRLDVLFLDRFATSYALDSFQDNISETKVRNYSIAPELTFDLFWGWTGSLAANYGDDRTRSHQTATAVDGTLLADVKNTYLNTVAGGEVVMQGPLLDLPGGPLRLAFGAGLRRNDYAEVLPVQGIRRNNGHQTASYAFAETDWPLIRPDQGVAFVHRLNLNGALRYERYASLGDVTTPKIGVVYDPVRDVSLRVSWGQSFKAPTLNQEFSPQVVLLYPAWAFGAVGAAPDATALFVVGGGGQLEPERAETLAATLVYRPAALPGLRLEASVFDIDYTDRVVQPIQIAAAVFGDPVWAPFLTRNPSAALQAATIAGSGRALFNITGAPYDPAKVVGIVDNTYTNVARQTARGVDLSAAYSFDLLGGGLALDASASWLDSDQQNTAGTSIFETVGLVYYPAEFRARAGGAWVRGNLGVSAYVNHVDGVLDTQNTPERDTGSFTTMDATVRYRTGEGGAAWNGLEIALTVSNLFDQGPPTFPALNEYQVNFDSTNYNVMGRVVSLSLTRRW
ncbi:MAG TPA: TonB-dependent receptor [Brevundimonas sp.]|uniref:TonB-dependent receptor n=1 Tax=Brevundimonas sp. TaxID=1871086 RepID=UPI00262A644B|nr:TonB-dependent receptor [Brevundimonas sp.]HRO33959.1 TonB-dependent receptor [Brevundimonas sp.]